MTVSLSRSRVARFQKHRLQHMTSRDGKDEFSHWVVAAQRSILEVFQEFPSVKPSFEALVQLLPRLSPRSYTICSSSVVNPNTVHLAVSLVRTVRRLLSRSWAGGLRWHRYLRFPVFMCQVGMRSDRCCMHSSVTLSDAVCCSCLLGCAAEAERCAVTVP